MALVLPQDFNLDSAILLIVPETIRDQPVTQSPKKLVDLKDSAKLTFMYTKRYGTWENEKITEKDRDGVKELVWLYYNRTELGIKFKSTPISAESVLSRLSDPSMKFPVEIQHVALGLKQKFEAFNWGMIIDSDSDSEPITITPRKRKSDALKDNGSSSLSSPSGVYLPAPNDHRIFGLNGIMHHIQRSKGGQVTQYRIQPGYNSGRDYKVFGHNGLSVGDCWAMQIAAMRDGAHGMRIAGICGTAIAGVYSIIVAGTYSDSDQDNGDTLHYATANAESSTDETPDLSAESTKALLRSQQTGGSIRVLRKSTAGWVNAPRKGLRYDGLYRVVGRKQRTNEKGGKYLSFELRREGGQNDIVTGRPTRREARDFERVVDGY